MPAPTGLNSEGADPQQPRNLRQNGALAASPGWGRDDVGDGIDTEERPMGTDTATHPTLHHVTLKTTRVDEMVGWYTTLVGMRTIHHSEFGAWLTNDGANHRLALLAHPGFTEDPDKIPHAGIHHMAFEYPGIDALLADYERLRDAGIVPHGCLDHGMTTSLYYADPDGSSVELQADNFGDWPSSTE
jgi:catechol-2,3-dioxygenase